MAKVGKKLRFEVFKRDDWTCRYCGARPPAVVLHTDHIVPVSEDGPTELDNLVTACEACNLGKGARGLENRSPPFDPDAPEVLAEKALQLRGYQESLQEWLAARKEFEAFLSETLCEALYHDTYGQMALGPQEMPSAMRFVERLGFKKVFELADYAHGKNLYTAYKTWRYFCGACWSSIREQEEEK